MNEYPDQIIAFSLFMTQSYCQKKFVSTVVKNRNIIEKRLYSEERSIEQFIQENLDCAVFSEKTGFTVFEIVDDFETTVDRLMTFLDQRLETAE